MGMIANISAAFPGLEMQFRTGHYTPAYDNDPALLDHVIVTRGDGAIESFGASEDGRRQRRKPKAVEVHMISRIQRFVDGATAS